MAWMFWKQRRKVICVMAFLAFYNTFSLSSNLSVAILGMTEKRYYQFSNGTVVKVQDFDWNARMQGLILSAYYYGNICTYVIGGWLATRYGSTTILVISAMFSAELTFGTPEVSRMHDYAIVVLRILLGGAQGIVTPCINVLWTKWTPASERSCMSSFAMSGCFVGLVCNLILAGIITHYFGWVAVFYFTGYVSLILGICFAKFFKDDPAFDPKVSEEELKYIQQSIGVFNRKIKIPWLKFVTSMPVWAVIVMHFCANWGLFTIITQFPIFLFETTSYGIKCIGLIAALPHISNIVALQYSGYLTDKIVKSGQFSLTKVRKLLICVSSILQAILIVTAAYIRVPFVIIVCIVITTAFDALAWSCFGVNFLDIATPYAGVLTGISSTFATIPGIITPQISGELVAELSDHHQFFWVFLLCGAFYTFGAIFYGIFGSAELQDWAEVNIEFVHPSPGSSSIGLIPTVSSHRF